MDKGLGRLLAVQTQVAFNDNAAKLALIGLAGLVLPSQRVEGEVGLLAVLLVLPFVLFAPLFGWLADRFPKTTVLRGALWIQTIVAAGLTMALAYRSLPAAAGCFFLLALQAALFSPAKQGILKEWVGSAGLNRAVGAMEALTIVAILAGGFGGGLLLDNLVRITGNPWHGAAEATSLLTVACILSALFFRGVPTSAIHSADPFRVSLLWEHFRDLRRMREQRSLLGAAGGIAWFYGLGGLLYLLLIQVGRETHPGLGAASHAGWLLVLLGGGIIAGALLYGMLSKGKISIGGVPFSALGMTGVLVLLGLVPLDGILFQSGLFALGVIGGTFIIPLNAFLQDRAEDRERGRMIAASNLLTNLMGIGAVGAQVLLAETFHIKPSGQMLGLALSGALVAGIAFLCQPRGAMKALAVFLSRLLYRTEVKGAENLPQTGGILLVCNHVSYADALLLGVSSPRPVRFLAFDGLFRAPLLGAILRLAGSIPVSPRRPKEAMIRAAEYLKAGEVVCIFPEGELTRTGEMMGFKRGFELIARKAVVPVVPVHLDSLWGSIFSFSGGRFFWKWPGEWPRRVRVSFGMPLPSEVSDEEARQAVLGLGEAAFRERSELRENLGHAALRRLAATPWKTLVIDCTKAPVAMSCGKILAAALVLASLWKKTVRGRRVGIALPPGRGAIIANLALVFAGKVPVNLNLTVSREAAEASLPLAGIEEIVTAGPIRTLFPKYPWLAATRDLAADLGGLSKVRLAAALLAIWILPARWLARAFAVASEGGDREALLLFTSGSSGDPKGVPLTHANILANVTQVFITELVTSEDRILGCLPLFHSFGSTFTLWTPLLCDVGLVTTPSPLDAVKVGAAVAAGKATLLLGTPTFLRAYARKVAPAEFASLRLAVAGAEKLPADLATLYREKYQVEIIEGYGLTETSPVLAANLPNPRRGFAAESEQIAHREGSVGRLFPGIAYRFADPETGRSIEALQAGLLQVKGANVFGGYLHDPAKTDEVLRNDWFTTGDLARVDGDGFLFIEGRLSRFAKIGGEMVPLAKIEETAIRTLGLTAEQGPAAALIALPHPTKGEELIFLSVEPVEKELLRRKLAEEGLSNLWIPRKTLQIARIPLLGTGKIDWRGCVSLAQQAEVQEVA